MNKIIVLDDGLRFSGIGASKILWITDGGMVLLEKGMALNNVADTYIKRCVYISDLLHHGEITRDMP